jgi:bifunctional oligoribonuclease and PAP phosphatase NrnA
VFERLARELRQARHVLLATHECPDGDGIGCQLAMRLVLAANGIESAVLVSGPVPPQLRFLPGADTIREWQSLAPDARAALLSGADLAFVLDTHNLSMIGPFGAALRAAETPTLFLDHHPFLHGDPDRIFCDAEASSTGELAWVLARELMHPLSAAVATCLYAAISYDTNSFKYLRGRCETHAAAAELVRLGADTDAVYRHLFASSTPGKVRLLGEVLRDCRFMAAGRIAWVRVPPALAEAPDVTRDDLRDAITHMLEIEGVELAASFLAIDPGRCRVSLRSMGRYPVSRIAQQLGGGGHRLAAGVQLDMAVDQAIPRVLALLEGLLDAEPPGASATA